MEREDMGRRLYQACLSGSVPALDALIEEDQLILDRVSSLTCFSDDTPLHVAALRGHLDFTKALLARKPKLATELDSLRCSPLHLASAEGHVEIVRELLRVNTDVCIARDQDGRIPLHLAVMKGRVEVILELLRAEPESIHEKLSRGETVLHLCVKYNRQEAFKTLVQYLHSNHMEFLLNAGDDNGNTILHLAAALKQKDVRGHLITAATLTATMAYQSILSPPGGLWQETKRCQNAASLALPPSSGYSDLISDDHICIAGQAIMDNDGTLYTTYMVSNTVMLIASLGTIMLAMTGFPSTLNKHLTWLMVITVFITIYCMAVSYQSAMALVSPNIWSKFYFLIIISVLGILCVFFLVLQSCRFLVWQWKKLVKLVKACYHCCGPTPRAAHNITTHDQVNPAAGSHKCIGNFC
ncbi:ankyrin repeat-containing protein BDA1-like isoform X2 [Rhododendron vialii]|uniref:ankyrin repeat-containing protein BDA1-like isoform X2 n=1 Tax=Rhododendron vialii TaxID=182163 RepID=UPI00266035E4|nr:ankyrin repeat-containing protein BDA1-like isoform X2 [Rhododendron vialii]XP_058193019.1 ankyrin repeat-containing protein BDA1-like isoform X2 [Rhododendron vialii]